MKTIERTSKKIVIEVTQTEINSKGFDALWDDVRDIYPDSIYEVESIESIMGDKIILIKLKFKKN